MNMQEILKAALAEAEAKANALANTLPPEPESIQDIRDITGEESLADDDYLKPDLGDEMAKYEDDSSADNIINNIDADLKRIQDTVTYFRFNSGKYAPYKKDKEATEEYGIGQANKHLFKTSNNRVKKANAAYAKLYKHVTDNTTPTTDDGKYAINTAKVDLIWFMREYERLESEANDAVKDLVDNWQQEVAEDMARIEAKRPGKSNINDYPIDIGSKYYARYFWLPVPEESHYKIQLTDKVKAGLRAELKAIEEKANEHVIKEMMKPMKQLVNRLDEYTGEKGQRFSDNLVTNMLEVAERMNMVNLSSNPAIQKQIDDLKNLASRYSKSVDGIRTTQTMRDQAKSDVEALMKQMGGLI